MDTSAKQTANPFLPSEPYNFYIAFDSFTQRHHPDQLDCDSEFSLSPSEVGVLYPLAAV
jgi:hypothetical protein